MSARKIQPARIAFLLDNLTGGGAQRVILNLLDGFVAAGDQVDLLVCKMQGDLKERIPANVNLVPLGTTSSWRGLLAAFLIDPGCILPVMAMFTRTGKLPGTFKSLTAITRYLRAQRPKALLSALPKSNVNAVLAGRRCRGVTRIALGVHVNYSATSRMDKEVERETRPLLADPDAHGITLMRMW